MSDALERVGELTDRVDMTDPKAKALGILESLGPMTAAHFAAVMWPDSWDHPRRCYQNGDKRPAGIILCAAGYLGKLAGLDLVRRQQKQRHDTVFFSLTDKGIRNLAAHEEGAP